MGKSSALRGASPVPVAIFLLSIIWFRRKERNKKFQTKEFEDSDDISARGIAALKSGSSYWESFLRVLQVSLVAILRTECHFYLLFIPSN